MTGDGCRHCEIERLTRENEELQYDIGRHVAITSSQATEIDKLQSHIDKLQSHIDSLMLEYCPGEMTREQYEKWQRHQKPVSKTEALSGEPNSAPETKERQYKGTRDSFYCPDCQCPKCGNTRPQPGTAMVNPLIGAAAQPSPGTWGVFCAVHGYREWHTKCPQCELSEKARGEPTSGSGCPACGVMYVAGARHFSGCPLYPGEAVLSEQFLT